YKLAMNRNNLIFYKYWALFISKTEYHFTREIRSCIITLNIWNKKYNLKTRFCVGYFVNGHFFIDIKLDSEDYISDEILVNLLNHYRNILNIKANYNSQKEFVKYCQDRGSVAKF